jgi:endonuclease/exonuclease/phosphatase (EEP) superfamily protein YafD
MKTSHRLWTICVLILAIGIGATSATGMVHFDSWLTDLVESFRPHLLVAALLASPLAFTLRRGWRAGTGALFLLCFVINGATILRAAQASVALPKLPGPIHLKLVTLNLLWSNQEHQKVLDWLRAEAPDIVLTQETTRRWAGVLDRLHDRFPHRRLPAPADDLAILSRHPFHMIEPSGIRTHGTLAMVRLTVGERRIDLVNLHASVPLNPAWQAARDVMLEDIASVARHGRMPLIVAGDFNATPWNRSMRRLVRESPLRHAADFWRPSWADHVPLWMGIPIDHVLAGTGCTVLDRRVGPDIGSDHRPVVATISCL